jgi:hypothetical protein
MASNNYIYKMSNAGGMSTVTRYVDMLAGNTVWNPWEPAGAYDALASVTVPSGGAASVEFAGIPTGYKHLQIRASYKCASNNWIYARVNSDATHTNYITHYLEGSGSAASAASQQTTNITGLAMNYGQSNSANIFDVSIMDILDYANTNKNKVSRSLRGCDNNGSGYVGLQSALWMNTAAINNLTIYVQGSSFNQYSHFALYGVK